MEYEKFRKWIEQLNSSLRSFAKARRINVSEGHDIYKKAGPYFYHSHYIVVRKEDDFVDIVMDNIIKFHRFDELQLGITRPGNSFKFTDELRANSALSCKTNLPCLTRTFSYNISEEPIPMLCEDLLDRFKKSYSDFLTMIKSEFGDLSSYYIANKENMPRLAGLAYLENNDFESAEECFSSLNMDGENYIWHVGIKTDEQRRRAKESETEILKTTYGEIILRSYKEQFMDYAVTLKNHLDWNLDRAMFGLLKEER